MSNVVDLDSLLAEQGAGDAGTVVRLRGVEWVFGQVIDVPAKLFAIDSGSSVAEMQDVLGFLVGAVDRAQREDFAALDLTVRELWGLFNLIMEDQQGASLGE